MRRLARRLFTLCSAVSLLLCVAACMLWVRSYLVADELTVIRTHLDDDRALWVYACINSSRGGLAAKVIRDRRPVEDRGPGYPPVGWRWYHRASRDTGLDVAPELKRADWWLLGFGHQSKTLRGVDYPWDVRHVQDVSLPHWAPAGVLAVLPAFYVARAARGRRRHSRALRKRCPECGYDLRASPGRCPECGAARA